MGISPLASTAQLELVLLELDVVSFASRFASSAQPAVLELAQLEFEAAAILLLRLLLRLLF